MCICLCEVREELVFLDFWFGWVIVFVDVCFRFIYRCCLVAECVSRVRRLLCVYVCGVWVCCWVLGDDDIVFIF